MKWYGDFVRVPSPPPLPPTFAVGREDVGEAGEPPRAREVARPRVVLAPHAELGEALQQLVARVPQPQLRRGEGGGGGKGREGEEGKKGGGGAGLC